MMGFGTDLIRRFARRQPDLTNRLWSAVYPLVRRPERYDGSEYSEDLEQTFTVIHDENRWGSEESVSGAGSTQDQTVVIRRELPKLMARLNATSLLDAPCGDFNWMRLVTFDPTVAYTGGDIVKPLIAKLQAEFAMDDRRFVDLDIVSDPLPEAGLWLCRDVLFHLSHTDILSVLTRFAQSNIGYLLTTTYDFVDNNVDIVSGGFRFINLRNAPFNLPKPRVRIDDYLAPEPPRHLGLWSRDDVAAALTRSRPF